MTKLDLVLEALKNAEIAVWYAEQFNITADSFSAANVNQYGGGGLGDIADAIIADAGLEQ